MKFHFYSVGYFLLAVAGGIAYGLAGTIMKKGAVGLKPSGNIITMLWRIFSAKYILMSLFFSGLGYILTVFIVRKAEVISTTLVIQAALFISMMFFASWMLKEAVTPSKIIAMVLIMAGIAVLVAGK